ncbi:MAG: sigma-54 dependent transcriptional regulator [Halioglobus sp.]
MDTGNQRNHWTPGCSDPVSGLPAEKNLLCYWNTGTVGNNLARELEASSWRVLLAEDITAASRIAENHVVPVGLLFLGSNLTLAELSDAYELTSTLTEMVWLALLTDRHAMNDEVCSLIATHCTDFFTPPYDTKRIEEALGHAAGLSRIRHRSLEHREAPSTFLGMVGDSASMRRLYRMTRKIAKSNAPVLITGESGTGKEVAANAIHRLSTRSTMPFVAINCAALPSGLVQAELFGHEKGAFTGAGQRRLGRFESANGGVLFLDEISDMPLEQQVNLLRFLEDSGVERLGGNGRVVVDVRVIAATHDDLHEAVSQGRFREDLYYRLNVLELNMPSLRERDTDIDLLADYFLEKYRDEVGVPHIRGFDRQALSAMRSHDWPGNVRELINRVRSAVAMTDGNYISSIDLGLKRSSGGGGLATLELSRSDSDRRAIEAALRRNQKNVSKTARDLGISRTTLYRMIEKLGVQV